MVQESVKIQQKGMDLVNHRHEGGVASGLDVAQQQTLLDSTVTQLYLLQQQRAQFEHAIAVLTGNPASTFSVPVAPLRAVPPPVPLGMPSDLLERRPDIATAERPWPTRMHWWELPNGVLSAIHDFGQRRLPEHHLRLADQRSQRYSGRWAAICCSRSSMAAAIAPISPPHKPPMRSPSPTIASLC